jgi:hypothetical protein
VLLPISSIRTDGGTQPRAVIDFHVVDDYMDAMTEGAKFPPVVVFYDGSDYWLADGFHRVKAAEQADVEQIAVDVHQGTQADAQWYSFAANKVHGLRRTNDDKQRAVKAALAHPNGAGKSNSQIARHVGVDEGTVRNWRDKMQATSEIPKSTARTGSDGRTINTANIGRKPAPSFDGGTRISREAPAPVSVRVTIQEPALESPQNLRVSDVLAQQWLSQIIRSAETITACEVVARDLVAALIERKDAREVLETLEKTNELINEIFAEAKRAVAARGN